MKIKKIALSYTGRVQLEEKNEERSAGLASTTGIVKMYTDGACTGNPGRGGYGVVILDGKSHQELSQGYRHTTNNRMELMAAIAGLQSLAGSRQVQLFTDSRYLCDAINLGWIKTWQKKGWRKTGKGKVVNPDLWKQLIVLLDRHKVELAWVQGHAGDKQNERADRLAVAAARSNILLEDEGYQNDELTDQPGLF